MRRLARWTLNALTVLSLLLCVATGVLWGRSYRVGISAATADAWDVTHAEPLYWVVSNHGRLTFCRQEGRDWQSPRPAFNVLGLEFAGSRVGGSSLYNLFVPYWMLLTLSLVLPVVVVTHWSSRRARRARQGQCPVCRYDLTGNVSGVCPECGVAIVNGTT